MLPDHKEEDPEMNAHTTKLRILTVAFAALALCIGTGLAAADDDGAKTIHRMEIHPDHDCDGDDCEKRVRRIEIKTDCDGDDCPEGGRAIFIGDGGDMKVLHGDDTLQWLSEDMQQGGFLGVSLTDLTDELKEHFGVPAGSGVLVSKIVDDSPAQKSGIQVGDIITLVDGEEVGSGRGLSSEISSREEGDTVTVELWRNGRAEQVSAVLGKREGHAMMRAMPRKVMMRSGGHSDHGMHIERIIECDGDDCEGGIEGYDCGADECRVEVRCEGEGDCSCTVNGDDVDCSEIPGFHGN